MRNILRDNGGDIPGLPLELIVIALVMAIVIPTVWSMSNYYRKQQMEDILLDELSKFKRTAEEVNELEPGNARQVSLSITSLSGVEYVRCGGDNPWNIRYKLKGGQQTFFSLGVMVTNLTDDGPRDIELPLDGTAILLSRSYSDPGIIEIRIGERS